MSRPQSRPVSDPAAYVYEKIATLVYDRLIGYILNCSARRSDPGRHAHETDVLLAALDYERVKIAAFDRHRAIALEL
jgi:hypothetical protein